MFEMLIELNRLQTGSCSGQLMRWSVQWVCEVLFSGHCSGRYWFYEGSEGPRSPSSLWIWLHVYVYSPEAGYVNDVQNVRWEKKICKFF